MVMMMEEYMHASSNVFLDLLVDILGGKVWDLNYQ